MVLINPYQETKLVTNSSNGVLDHVGDGALRLPLEPSTNTHTEDDGALRDKKHAKQRKQQKKQKKDKKEKEKEKRKLKKKKQKAKKQQKKQTKKKETFEPQNSEEEKILEDIVREATEEKERRVGRRVIEYYGSYLSRDLNERTHFFLGHCHCRCRSCRVRIIPITHNFFGHATSVGDRSCINIQPV